MKNTAHPKDALQVWCPHVDGPRDDRSRQPGQSGKEARLLEMQDMWKNVVCASRDDGRPTTHTRGTDGDGGHVSGPVQAMVHALGWDERAGAHGQHVQENQRS